MDPDAGISFSRDLSFEPILSVTHHFTGWHRHFNRQNYYLIITVGRIICVNIDGLLAAHRKDVLAGKITAPAGPLGFLMAALSLDGDSVDFSEHFRKMHPSEIVAAHPDAVIIPMDKVVSFEVWQDLYYPIDYSYSIRSVVKITGGGKTLEVSGEEYPGEILENDQLKALLGTRFIPPKTDFFRNHYLWKKGE